MFGYLTDPNPPMIAAVSAPYAMPQAVSGNDHPGLRGLWS